ncbi:PD-(D/E)XK nuclease family protein [Bifidobacterium moukalabense]|uniref:PD-(D/E)XK nuclease superfamily protein n=1 Tax=Bifidobacterium moukalabense DSM 27321 TaxID=1435051 RepID=W4N9Y6_9BIFI|nr:PD-(D/E)XK nuclease family protein [Bifidobacterium moukalabense]ETY71918.1 PD-(D/E)XK nuclease superfamily protein [Bifidobacterium moukalabense DSM 27321]
MDKEVNLPTLENSPNQNTEKPFSRNLFDYATSELSQDAFICWICAQFDSNDATVRTASQNLLHAFLGGNDNDPVGVKEIYRQKENIDVLLLLQYKGQEFPIVVEDKTSSRYHNDQLDRYRTSAASIYDRGKNDIRVVYFKTETVYEEQDIRNKCDIVLNRKDILECLNTTSKNPILMDYVDRLKRICARYDQYRSLPVKDWSYDGWCGFFEYLQKKAHH